MVEEDGSDAERRPDAEEKVAQEQGRRGRAGDPGDIADGIGAVYGDAMATFGTGRLATSTKLTLVILPSQYVG